MTRRAAGLAGLALALLVTSCGGRAGVQIAQRRFQPDTTGLRGPVQPSAAACGQLGTAAGQLGEVVLLDRGALDVLDFRSCHVRRIVSRGASAPVRFSPDGRWIAYGPQATLITVDGAPAGRPLPALQPGAWSWSPRRDLLLGVTTGGGVISASPSRAVRRLLPDGFGATGLVVGPGGEAAVSREVVGAGPPQAELWMLDPNRLLYRDPTPGASVEPWGFTADGRWLVFWANPTGSASIAADGLPLEAAPAAGGPPVQIAPAVLPEPALLAACQDGIALARGAGRDTSLGKRIAITAPPAWHPRTITPPQLSFVSPTCVAGGAAVAAAAGPSRPPRVFGEEGRSIFLLSPSGENIRQLTEPPPAGITDESPHLAPDQHYVLFIRSGPTGLNAQSPGQLYLATAPSQYYARVLGPFAQLGPATDYYGAYDWAAEFDWHER